MFFFGGGGAKNLPCTMYMSHLFTQKVKEENNLIGVRGEEFAPVLVSRLDTLSMGSGYLGLGELLKATQKQT